MDNRIDTSRTMGTRIRIRRGVAGQSGSHTSRRCRGRVNTTIGERQKSLVSIFFSQIEGAGFRPPFFGFFGPRREIDRLRQRPSIYNGRVLLLLRQSEGLPVFLFMPLSLTLRFPVIDNRT